MSRRSYWRSWLSSIEERRERRDELRLDEREQSDDDVAAHTHA